MVRIPIFFGNFRSFFWPVRNPNKNAINGHLAQGEADASEDEEHFWHSDILAFLAPLDLGPKTHTRLVINDVIKEDSGNYTCSAPNTVASSIDVFVSPG